MKNKKTKIIILLIISFVLFGFTPKENDLCLERGHVFKTPPKRINIHEEPYLEDQENYSIWVEKIDLELHYICERCGEIIADKTYIRDTIWVNKPIKTHTK